MKPCVLLLNPTCLEIVDTHRDWLSTVDIELTADPTHLLISAERLAELVLDFDGLIIPSRPSVTADLLHRARRLRVLSLAASGFDTIDVAAATAEGIVVTNAVPPEGAEVVAELTWGLILAVARKIPLHNRQVRAGDYHRGMGTSLWHRTLGIVGLGQIGRAVARRAAGFEMKVLANDPLPDVEFASRHGIQLVSLDELLVSSDVISLHARLDESTRGMIGTAQLSRIKPTAFVINAARRELMDEEALVHALQQRRISGAGLDDPPSVPDSPLLTMANVVMTPHLGNLADIGVDAVFRCAVQNAADVLAGRRCRMVVNPDVFRGKMRAAIA